MEARRAAEERERREARNHQAGSADSIRAALALIALAGQLQGWPPSEDPSSLREDALAYERWQRLRQRLQS